MACCIPCALDPRLGAIADASDDPCGKTFLPPVAFVWPSDVREKIAELDPQWKATDVAIKGCGFKSDSAKAAWSGDFAAWNTFVAEGVPTFGAANKLEAALRFQCRLRQWQDQLEKASCDVGGPKAPTPTSVLEEGASTVTKIAIAGAVIAGVVLVAPVVWEWSAARLAKRKRR